MNPFVKQSPPTPREYRTKVGVDVTAAQFDGTNVMDLFNIVPNASWLHLTPKKYMKIYYYADPKICVSDEVEIRKGDWLVVDEVGPMAVPKDLFSFRYERNEDATS